jgi:hypothetical protein
MEQSPNARFYNYETNARYTASGMKSKFARASFILVTTLLFATGFLLYIIVYSEAHFTALDTASNNNINMGTILPVVSTGSPIAGRVVVLLQQSQVQQSKQLVRLHNIDVSWALWASKGFTEVVAVLPYQIDPTLSKFNIIRSIRMFPIDSTSKESDNISSPYHNLIKAMFDVISISDSMKFSSALVATKWLVIGNDHTFVVPGNLRKFLQALDADNLVYSGNQLNMEYRNRVVSFASGGAGAVLSHVLVKLMLSAWLLGTEDSLLLSLLYSYDASSSKATSSETLAHESVLFVEKDVSSPTAVFNIADTEPKHRGMSMKCMLSLVNYWLRNNGTDGKRSKDLKPGEGSSSSFVSCTPNNFIFYHTKVRSSKLF